MCWTCEIHINSRNKLWIEQSDKENGNWNKELFEAAVHDYLCCLMISGVPHFV